MRSALILVILSLCSGAAQGQEREAPPYPDRGLKGTVSVKRLPISPHPVLLAGGEIWDQNCRVCHGTGNFGAPKITGARFWKSRISKGITTLIGHAQNGFETSLGGLMPARGGNTELTDADVEAAVRFMVFHSGGADIALQGLD